MGVYIYKVIAKKVKCSDGEWANVAVYAFKPSGWDEKYNRKMLFQTGCYRADDYANGKNCTDRIVISEEGQSGEPVYLNRGQRGFFYDDYELGHEDFPKCEGIVRA